MKDIPGQLAFPPPTPPDEGSGVRVVEIRRSNKRRRTVSARLVKDTLIVYLPERLSKAEEAQWVEKMRQRLESRQRRDRLNSEDDLQRRASELNKRYFGGTLQWRSIRYVTNQRSIYGSCTSSEGTIRLSDTLADMPTWVSDYVIVHELAHLLRPDHGQEFWKLCARYPLTERARGFLIAKGMEES